MGDTTPSEPLESDEPITVGAALALARVSAKLLATQLDEVVVGRYRLHERIGLGGMGSVHRARDPDLDRDVAIKLVPSADGETRQRMLREAEALARLSHPNVVQIFDVGTYDAGERAGGVYIVMELVPGGTLSRWLRDATHSYDEIVAKLVAAGRGLAAAHAAGLVHRDFKPGNVLLAGERVLVSDFGLARAPTLDGERISEPSEGDVLAGSGRLATVITSAGTTMGTPAYMAPEQHGDERVDERSDQYSFCVALWEGLYGVRPFDGVTIDALVLAKLGEAPSVPEGAREVPRAVRRAIVRGLAADPAARWPSMHALLDEVSRTGAPRRRPWLPVLGGLAAVGLGMWGWQHLQRSRALHACAAEGERIAATWNALRADEIAAAFDTLAIMYAADAWTRAREKFDAYAAKWAATRTEVCKAGEIESTLPNDIAAASRACLDEQLDELHAIVERLVRPDAEIVQSATMVGSSLPLPTSCTDEASLRGRAEAPADPAMRERVAGLRKRMSEVAAARALERHAEALPEAEAVRDEAEGLPWPPLVAEVEHTIGETLWSLGRYEEARVKHEAAYLAAVALDDDGLALKIATSLVQVVGVDLARHDEGLVWSRRGAQHQERLGLGDDDLRRANLATSTGSLRYARGEHALAREQYQLAFAIREKVLGAEHPQTALSLDTLGVVDFATGEYEDALELYERSLPIWEAAVGPDHRNVANSLNNLGVLYNAVGEQQKSLEALARVVAIREKTFDPNHPDLALSIGNLGNAHFVAGDKARALELFERALAIQEKSLDPDHPDIASILHSIISLYHAQGEYDRALELLPRALAIRTKAFGEEHHEVGLMIRTYAALRYAKGDHAGALADYTKALAILEKTLGPDHPETVKARDWLAVVRAATKL